MPWIKVDVKEDHLRALFGQPKKGIEELLWNAIDADSTEIQVSIIENELGGVSEVQIIDNGCGMTPDEVAEYFGHLGGSWKALKARSAGNRPLHGKLGQGRWRAFGIGNQVRWETIGIVDGERVLTTIKGYRDRPNGFEVSTPTSTERPCGTTVIIDSFTTPPKGIVGERCVANLTASFALAIEAFNVAITYDSVELDPSSVQVLRKEYDVPLTSDDRVATLTIIEWNMEVDRLLYLCDPDGSTLHEIPPDIQAPGFNFTAYLRWEGFAEHVHDILLAELGKEEFREPIDRAKDKLREHFRSRSAFLTQRLIDEWKEENLYPFAGEPSNPIEAAERQVFDVVALAASKTVNATTNMRSRKLSLNLIKVALENDPGDLQKVLVHVLDLPADRIEELRQVLEQTSLTSLIKAAKTITNRLSFIRALEILIFDHEVTGKVRERSQLHRILASETWIFGEEFALTADDESLNTVLTRHLSVLGRERMADDEVLDENGNRRIIDLMLSRTMEQIHERREHVVIELKAPHIKAGPDELTQIKNYAFTVKADSRFDSPDVQWDFILVVNELTNFADQERNQRGRERGLVVDQDDLRVWVKSWAEVISAANHRLKFVQRALEFGPNTDQALSYLRETHEKYLPSRIG